MNNISVDLFNLNRDGWNGRRRGAYGKFPFFRSLQLVFFVYSNVPSSNGFQQMARMMDSLILNEFPPYTFTKITATHRPTRTPNGLAAKLLTKSSAMSPTGGLAGVIRPTMQKPKVPLQGKWTRRAVNHFQVAEAENVNGKAISRDILIE